ncbi:transcription factor E2F3 isoform X2 [Kryptolebias marmoratus]|uniref:transcription factor E2F3 isoform X2 n=1 Tax=Kryptolebias marmoratus TaxID=37003 RepID=UPI0007F88DB4|nr:transcription factor E2F3 isoform X2 [Kryptolebias marmoratus]
MKFESGAAKTKKDMSFRASSEKKSRKSLRSLARYETSLCLLTRRFAEKLSRSVNGVLDLNEVSEELGVSKRRIYDVTNVLKGIRLIRKKSKSHIQWVGKKANEDELEELVALAEEEEELDYLIQSCTQQIRKLCEQRHIHRYAYLTYADVCGIQSLKGQTVIVIKAPAETKVQVPHPEESLQVHIRSTNGPIEVFLCSDPMESTGNTAASSADGSQFNSTTCGSDSLPLPPLPRLQESSRVVK